MENDVRLPLHSLVAQLIFIVDLGQVLLYRTSVYHFRITIIKLLLLSVTIMFDF